MTQDDNPPRHEVGEAPSIPQWLPPADTPTKRHIVAAMQTEFASPQWIGRAQAIDSIEVAVSGGVDSVVLLHLLLHLRQSGKLALPLSVAHFDHQLREDSANDAAFVRELADAWGLPFRLGTGQIASTGEGIEAAARRARYQFLLQQPDAESTPQRRVVMTAHHADDSAETILMHLARGSGLEGLAAMRAQSAPASRDDGVFRPLLRIQRAEIAQYAQENGLRWREDPTNAETHFMRNLIRQEVMPHLATLNPQAGRAFDRFARIAGYEALRLLRLTKQQFDAVRLDQYDGERFLLDLRALVTLPLADQIALLRYGVRNEIDHTGHALESSAPGIDELEWLASAVRELGNAPHAHNSGPHPWYGGLAWSAVVRPPLFGKRNWALSVHLASAAPWVPAGPWIEEADTHLLRQRFTLPWSLTLASEWRLRVRKIDLAKRKTRRSAPGAVWFDAAKLTACAIAVPEPGMQIAPLGMAGKHKSLGNLFTDHKIPRALRHKWPLILNADTGEVLWVSWLAQAEHAKVTAETKSVWEVQWRDEKNGDRSAQSDQRHGLYEDEA